MNLKKFGLSILTTIVIKFWAVAIGLYTSRWMIANIDKVQLAEFNVLLSFVAVIYALIHFGIPITIQKHFTSSPKESNAELWTSMFFLRLISFPVGLFLIYILLPFTGSANLLLAFAIYSMGFFLIADLSYRAVTDSNGNSWQFSITDLVSKVFIVSGLIFYVRSGSVLNIQSLYYFIIISTIGNCLAVFLDFLWQAKHIQWGKWSWEVIKANRNVLFFVGGINAISALYTTTDKIFLQNFGASPEIINGYSNGYKILDLATIIIGLSMPIIASFTKRRMDERTVGKLEQNVSKFLKLFGKTLAPKPLVFTSFLLISFGIGLISFVGMNLFGPLIIRIIDPLSKYPQAILSLQILSFSLLPAPINFLIGYTLHFTGGEKYDFLSYIIILSSGILMYVLLIPAFGFVGAALATSLIYCVELFTKVFVLISQKAKLKTFA